VAVGGVRFTTASGDVVVPGRRLAAGGQGEVFTVSAGQVFKRYFPATLDSDPSLERRLRAVAGHAPAGWREPGGHLALAWPAKVVLGDGRFAGFLMPAVDMAQTVGLHRITNPTDRRAATGMTAWARGFTWEYLVRTAINLAGAVRVLHQGGVVIGDFNEANVRVWRHARVTLLDCDSMQVTDPASGERFFCPVGRPEFTPPELLHADWRTTVRQPSSDLFALAVHVHQLLLEGEHPFRGLWRGTGDKPPVPELARAGTWAQREGGLLSPRPAAVSPALLPPAITGMFRRAFEDGAIDPGARPTALQWQNALTVLAGQLRRCDASRAHFYPVPHAACPWCRHEAARKPVPAASPRIRPLGASPAPIHFTVLHPMTQSALAPALHLTPAPKRAASTWRRHRTAIEVGFVALALIGLVVGLIVAQGPGTSPARTLTQPDAGQSNEATFSRDGTTLATADSSAYVWNTATGHLAVTLGATSAGPFDSDALALSPDGKTLATSDQTAQAPAVTLWDLTAGRAATFTPHLAIAGDAMAFSPDGTILALGDDDGRVDLWSVRGKQLIATLSDGSPASPVTALAFSPGGQSVAAARRDGSTCVWDLATRHPLRVFTVGQPDAVAFSPDGKMLAIGDFRGGAAVWDLGSGKPAGDFRAPADNGVLGVTAVTFSPDSATVAVGDSGAGDTSVWNVKTKRLIATEHDPGGSEILAVAFSPDGKTLATADLDGSTYVWDTTPWQSQ